MVAAAGGGADREVIIRIRTVADQANAAALRGVAESIKRTNGEAAKTHQTLSKSAEKAAKEQTREWDKANKEQLRSDLRTFNARMKAIKEREKAEILAAREIEKAVKNQAKEQERAARATETALGKVREANAKTVEAFKQSLEGAMALGRGMATLGIVGEQDTEKLLRALIKVQAAFDIMRGTVTLVQALTRGYQAYRTAVLAAAAAQATLAAAQGGGAAAGAGGMAAKGLGGLAVGGAGLTAGAAGFAAAGVAFAGTMAYQTMQPGGAKPGSMADRIGLGEVRAAGWMASESSIDRYEQTGESGSGLYGEGQRLRAAERRTARMQAARDATQRAGVGRENRAEIDWQRDTSIRAMEREAAISAAERQALAANPNRPERAAQARSRVMAGEVAGAESRYAATQGPGNTTAAQVSAARELLSIYQQQQQIAQQTAQIESQAAQAKFDKARSEIDLLKQKFEMARQEKMAAEASRAGSLASFGMMGAEQRAQFVAAANAVKAGTASAEQLQMVSGGPSSKLAEIARAQASRAGQAALAGTGLEETFTAIEDRRIRDAQRGMEGARTRQVTVETGGGSRSYTINSESKLMIDVKMDERRMAEQFRAVTEGIESKISAIMRKIIEEEWERRALDNMLNQQAAASGDGAKK